MLVMHGSTLNHHQLYGCFGQEPQHHRADGVNCSVHPEIDTQIKASIKAAGEMAATAELRPFVHPASSGPMWPIVVVTVRVVNGKWQMLPSISVSHSLKSTGKDRHWPFAHDYPPNCTTLSFLKNAGPSIVCIDAVT